LEEVLSYLDQGVENDTNLDPYLKEKGNRIPLSKEEKKYVISFLKTLTDYTFIKNN
jgi:cytoChrome-c peroxidase